MLPLGRKNARRCTECGITCHASCAHLVPDFCGMPMETANALLGKWKEINRGKPRLQQRTSPPHPDYAQVEDVDHSFDQMQLSTSRDNGIMVDDSQARYGDGMYPSDRRQYSLDAPPYSPHPSYPAPDPGEKRPPATYPDQPPGKPGWEGYETTAGNRVSSF